MNILLGLANVLDNETVIKNICEILDIDYEEIKDKLPQDEEKDTEQVEQELNDITPDDGGDGDE